jgi:hypothetical protein
MTTQRDALSNKEKEETDNEVFEIITDNMKFFGIEASPNMFKFAFNLFLAGVKFIPSKK